MVRTYNYDAFITYRHLPLDEAVASRIQDMLERYIPPKGACGSKRARIGRIFRDKTELPTSSDLDQALKNALLSSKYLILILSEETKNSKWCMEEVRLFKEAHNGSIDHILPVLVSGEPDESIPQILRFETQTDESGEEIVAEVEPLCCDVRADKAKDTLKKLKTEYLRLAAPLLDCGFDDLYQRHKRRAKKQRLLTGICTAAAVAVLVVLGYNSYTSYHSYRQNLFNTYLRYAVDLTETDPQQALMYYSAALSIDGSSQAAKTGALMLLQQNTWLIGAESAADNNTNLIEEQYGEVIGISQDGSCSTYFDGNMITFRFPSSDKTCQISLPDKINLACNTDSVIGAKPAAMALNENRALIRYGGYLYLYNLEDNGDSTLFDMFDLALVFPEDAANCNLDLYNEMWVHTKGRLTVIYNSASAAVFDVSGENFACLNAVHTNYGYALNDVVFSSDGSCYALVYGNHYGINLHNPGGYVEVYDEYGELIMSTPVDTNIVPESASISPDNDSVMVWGNGVLQVWNLSTAASDVVPIQLEQIMDACWTDDGKISVIDGSGIPLLYSPTVFNAATENDMIPETLDIDTYAKEFLLSDGYRLKHNYSEIWLEDASGTIMGSKSQYMVNKMYACPGSDIAYLWYDNSDNLIRVTVNQDRSGMLAEKLEAVSASITDVVAVPDGAVAICENDTMLYFPIGTTAPKHTMVLDSNGNVESCIGTANGLFAIVHEKTQLYSSQSYQYEKYYDLTLWDLNTGLCIAKPVSHNKKCPESLSLAENGWLYYELDGMPSYYLVNIADADSTDVSYLGGISCMYLVNDENRKLQSPNIESANAGRWKEIITPSQPTDDSQPTVADAYIAELDQILSENGENAWLARYDEIWHSLDCAFLLSDYLKLLRDYLQTARSIGRLDDVGTGIQATADAFVADAGQSIADQLGFTIQVTQYMLQSQSCDDIIIDYWLRMADAEEANYDLESEDWYYDFLGVYEKRLYANLLLGYGGNAFFYAIDEVYWDSLADILVEGYLDGLYYMVRGNSDSAAISFNSYLDLIRQVYAYDQESCRYELDLAVMFVMYDYHMLQQRGVLKEEDISAFMDQLSVNAGIKITQVSSQNLNDGLYLGDILTAVNGTRVFNHYHVADLMKKYPSAQLTVTRNNRTFTTKTMDDWRVSGSFYTE